MPVDALHPTPFVLIEREFHIFLRDVRCFCARRKGAAREQILQFDNFCDNGQILMQRPGGEIVCRKRLVRHRGAVSFFLIIPLRESARARRSIAARHHRERRTRRKSRARLSLGLVRTESINPLMTRADARSDAIIGRLLFNNTLCILYSTYVIRISGPGNFSGTGENESAFK